MKKKILFVHHGIGVGGALINLKDIVQELSSEHYDVHVLFLRDSDAVSEFDQTRTQIIVSRYPIYYFYHMSKWLRWYQLHKLIPQVLSYVFHRFYVSKKYLKELQPDVVYLNSSVLVDWLKSAAKLNITSVMNIQETIANGHVGLRKRLIAQHISANADWLIFISKYNREILAKVNSQIEDKSTVVYNTVLPIEKDQLRQLKTFDFSYLGGGERIKGWPLLKSLLKSDLDFKILVMGYFVEQSDLDVLESDSRVTFIGPTNSSLEYIQQSKFLLCPFIEPHFSRPIIEAYYCGVVPIATKLPGIEEQLIPGKTGLVFDKNEWSFLRAIEDSLNMSNSDYFEMLAHASEFRSRFERRRNLELAREVIDNVAGLS